MTLEVCEALMHLWAQVVQQERTQVRLRALCPMEPRDIAAESGSGGVLWGKHLLRIRYNYASY